tara:strand:- start:504 stop:848 length:345 start_codon:yes stop_codon:yes gene_type:complete
MRRLNSCESAVVEAAAISANDAAPNTADEITVPSFMFFSSFGAFRTLPDATACGNHLPDCARTASMPGPAQQFFKLENAESLQSDESPPCTDKQSGHRHPLDIDVAMINLSAHR